MTPSLSLGEDAASYTNLPTKSIKKAVVLYLTNSHGTILIFNLHLIFNRKRIIKLS